MLFGCGFFGIRDQPPAEAALVLSLYFADSFRHVKRRCDPQHLIDMSAPVPPVVLHVELRLRGERRDETDMSAPVPPVEPGFIATKLASAPRHRRSHFPRLAFLSPFSFVLFCFATGLLPLALSLANKTTRGRSALSSIAAY